MISVYYWRHPACAECNTVYRLACGRHVTTVDDGMPTELDSF